MNKNSNKVHQHVEMVDNLRRRGVSYSLNFIFGWDSETPDVFRTMLDKQ